MAEVLNEVNRPGGFFRSIKKGLVLKSLDNMLVYQKNPTTYDDSSVFNLLVVFVYIVSHHRSAVKILRKEKPDLIISSGAAVAVPFFYIGKLLGAKLIYVEVFDRINSSTLTGKLVYPVADRFIVEWEEMKKVYPKAINLGSIF